MQQPIDRESLLYRQGVTAYVLDQEGKILIFQHPSYQEHEWSLPGGGKELGESNRQAVLRELMEEFGSNEFEVVDESSQLNRYEFPDWIIEKGQSESRKLERGQEKAQLLVRFFGDLNSLRADPKEIADYKWVATDNLEDYLIFPNQGKIAFEALSEWREKGVIR